MRTQVGAAAFLAVTLALVLAVTAWGKDDDNAGVAGRVATLVAPVVEQQAAIEALQEANQDLSDLLAFVSVEGTEITITGANLHVVNGLGATETTNGLGNVIFGYNELRGDARDDRSGSHMVVVGRENSYRSYGGIVVGLHNTTAGALSSVSGGTACRALGESASVTGGATNEASGSHASVNGGSSNVASGTSSAVSRGNGNVASGNGATVSGGTGLNADDPTEHLP